MADTITVYDATDSSNQGFVASDSGNYTAITSGTGGQFTWEDANMIALLNGSGASRTFTITVPNPPGTSLADVGSTCTDKTYSVAAGASIMVPNNSAFKDTSTGLVVVDVSGSSCSMRAVKI